MPALGLIKSFAFSVRVGMPGLPSRGLLFRIIKGRGLCIIWRNMSLLQIFWPIKLIKPLVAIGVPLLLILTATAVLPIITLIAVGLPRAGRLVIVAVGLVVSRLVGVPLIGVELVGGSVA